MEIVTWLSSLVVVALEQLTCRSCSNRRNQTASCVARQSATYSDSEVDKDTLGCFLLVQLIAPSDIINTLPEVDFRSSVSEAQSASEYPSTSVSLALY